MSKTVKALLVTVGAVAAAFGLAYLAIAMFSVFALVLAAGSVYLIFRSVRRAVR